MPYIYESAKFLLVFLFVTVLFSQQSVLAATTTLQLPPRSSLGMNYYHESMGYISRTDSQIREDLVNISHITDKIKVYYNPFNSANLANTKNIVSIAKEQGFYVVWVENDDNTTLTDATWSTYANLVISNASDALAVGADEFLVGNELSLHNNGDTGFSDANLPTRVKTLADSVDDIFTGLVGYEDGWYKDYYWNTSGLGVLDKIYFTLYEPWDQYKSALDNIVNYFGDRAEIGEVSSTTVMSDLNYNEADWTRELMRRYDYASAKGVTIWPFAFRETTNNSFGLFQFSPADQPHQVWGYLEGAYSLRFDEYLSNNFNSGTTQDFTGQGDIVSSTLEADEFETTTAAVPVGDYVFRGTVNPVSTSGGDTWRVVRLVFRYTDDNNYYFIAVSANENKVFLYRKQLGVETWLGEVTTSLSLGSLYSFEARVVGTGANTRIAIFWDTKKIFDVTDTGNTSLNSGSVGMRNNGIKGQVDDVLVTSFESEVSLTTAPTTGVFSLGLNSRLGWKYDIMAGPSYLGPSLWILGYSWANEAMTLIGPEAGHDDMYVSITRHSIDEQFKSSTPFVYPWTQGLNQVGDYYLFSVFSSFNGYPITTFQKPVSIVIPYFIPDLKTKDPRRLKIARLNMTTKKWEVLRSNTVVDAFQHNVSNTTTQFGYFTLVYTY